MIRLYTLAALILGLLHTSATAQHISHDKLTGMRTRTETLVQLVNNYLTPDNTETPNSIWQSEYLTGHSSSGPLLSFGAQCSFSSPENNTDKKAELLLLANDLSPLLGHFVLNGNDYGAIRATITRRNGCLYFQLPQSQAADNPSDERSTSFWLITADSSRLPYTPVTRREFLLETRKQLIRDTNEIAADWRDKIAIRPTSQQEAEKQNELRQLKSLYSGADLEARTNIFLRNYSSDEAYLQRNINLAAALHRNALHFIDSLLHTDAGDLNRPAVISPQTAEAGNPAGSSQAGNPTGPTQTTRFKAGHPGNPTASNQPAEKASPEKADPALSFHGFADNLPGALLLVRLNPAALNPYLSADKPQFLLLGWRFDPSTPFAAYLDQQLHNNLDSRKIQDLLGK